MTIDPETCNTCLTKKLSEPVTCVPPIAPTGCQDAFAPSKVNTYPASPDRAGAKPADAIETVECKVPPG